MRLKFLFFPLKVIFDDLISSCEEDDWLAKKLEDWPLKSLKPDCSKEDMVF
ncbi:hypothetical protein ATG66_4049 [Vibrio sp. ES.051]|nr:hypothetical protein ATG66_4049 [Vibrio sp. ES.051]